MADETYVFGSFQLVPAQRLLLNGGGLLRLGSRALEILITLVERAGEIVSKNQLIGRVWPDTVVDEGALRVHVAAVRKALGDGREGNRFIVNDPGRGYSFVAPVTRERWQQAPAPPPEQPARSGNLPVLLTRVVGRDEVIETAVSRCSQHRLVTIVCPGTRGREYARASCDDGARRGEKAPGHRANCADQGSNTPAADLAWRVGNRRR